MKALAASLLLLAACPTPPTPCIDDHGTAPTFSAKLQIVSESGAPIASATATVEGATVAAGADGTISLVQLDQPKLVLVGAPGYFTEPVPIGPGAANTTQTIKLWAQTGQRFVMHNAGDVMFGRRFETPTTGDPLIPQDDAANGAQRVVASMSPAFSIADMRTVNLETVISDRDSDNAYPGKRYILRSRPGTLAGLTKLGVDVPSQANNHARDYMDNGVADSIAALAAANFPIVGESADGGSPSEGVIKMIGGLRVGVVAYTTVDGSTVNDAYPLDGDPVPSDVAPENAWIYQGRDWSFSGATTNVPAQQYRIGTVWSMFETVENMVSTDVIAMWASLAAVYPEMQDWVARRGHGGAAKWTTADGVAAVQAVRAQADLVVVQLHAGYQFINVGSDTVHMIARQAIDAGADIVIAHHPHVLQGFEFYKGHLIAYSMGNFIFDQDFLTTFGSVFLRTIWDGNQLLEARLVPIEISGYRPVPVTDQAARNNLFTAWERSVTNTTSSKDDVGVRAFPSTTDGDTQVAHIILEHDTARLTPNQPTPQPVHVDLPAGGVVPIGFTGLVDAQLGNPDQDILVGKDLFGWGRFEDETADQQQAGDTHWDLDSCQEAAMQTGGATGNGFLRIQRNQAMNVLVRPVARVPLPRHLVWQHDVSDGDSTPLDPEPSYSLHLRARRSGASAPIARIEGYNFDDTNPTEDPDSTLLGSHDLPIDIPADNAWHEIDLPVTLTDLDTPTLPANMIMLYFTLDYARTVDNSTLDVDDVEFIEWRTANGMTPHFGDYRWVKNQSTADTAIDFMGWPATQ